MSAAGPGKVTVVHDPKGGPGHVGFPPGPTAVTALLTRPAYGPVDELTSARLRRVCAEVFGSRPCLHAHLKLLDARGAWYAERAITVWRATHPDAFFGLVRHVVSSQFDGPRPDPDVETWLAAGRPSDRLLWPAYDLIATARYGRASIATPRTGEPEGAVGLVDDAIRTWPEGHLASFVSAYGRIEPWLERHAIVLPPIDFE